VAKFVEGWRHTLIKFKTAPAISYLLLHAISFLKLYLSTAKLVRAHRFSLDISSSSHLFIHPLAPYTAICSL